MERGVNLSGENKTQIPGVSGESINQLSNSEALRQVRAVWPNAFSIVSPKPLKIGIHNDMNACEVVPKEVVSVALRFYTSLDRYLQQIKPGAVRIDLLGKVSGKVRLKEAVDAEVKLYLSSSDNKKNTDEKELENIHIRQRFVIRKIRLLSVR